MAKWHSAKGMGPSFRFQRNSMKYGQSWDSDEQAKHNRKRRAWILTPEQELAETVRRQKMEN